MKLLIGGNKSYSDYVSPVGLCRTIEEENYFYAGFLLASLFFSYASIAAIFWQCAGYVDNCSHIFMIFDVKLK